MAPKKTIKDIEVKDKICLVRVDFNVPFDENGEIAGDTRILNSMPTIHNLIARGAKVVLISHLGRPKFRDESLSLKKVIKRTSELLGKDEIPLFDIDDNNIKEKINNLKKGEVAILENIRFCPEEEKNSDDFAKYLSSLGDIFVNDAFGVSHRVNASTVGITKYLPSVAGLLLEEEIKIFKILVKNPPRPFVGIIGGKKISDKIKVIGKLLEKADTLIIGGGVANTFLKAWGYDIGDSVYEEEMIEVAKDFIWKAMQSKTALRLPKDVVLTDEISKNANYNIAKVYEDFGRLKIVDIGPETLKEHINTLKDSGSVIWSGPIGVYEIEKFRKGNDEILKAISESGANSYIGGGDTIAACIKKQNYFNKLTHVSTGGGALLSFLEKETLPAIEALMDK